MKYKYPILFLLFLASICFASCKHEDTPSVVAEKFLNHVENGEYDEAKKYCPKGDEGWLDKFKYIDSIMGKKPPHKVEIVDEEIRDDLAFVTYTQNNENKKIDLIKVNNEWKIRLKKENPYPFDSLWDANHPESIPKEDDTIIEEDN